MSCCKNEDNYLYNREKKGEGSGLYTGAPHVSSRHQIPNEGAMLVLFLCDVSSRATC